MPKYTSFKNSINIQMKNNIIDFSTPKIMGILNLSADSFFDGGKYSTNQQIIQRCQDMINEGADIIDIGASSSRPGSKFVTQKEELERLLPTIQILKERFNNIIISIDTWRSTVAKECLENNADMINDISAGDLDPNIIPIIAEYQVPYIITHMQGTPTNMQEKPYYKNVVHDVFSYLKNKIKEIQKNGVTKIIIDPGFGFGKTIEHNYKLLNNLNFFQKLKLPILAGTSRKSMIYKLLKSSPKEALNGTTVTNTVALQNGANILRVHDVKEARECIKIFNFAKNIE